MRMKISRRDWQRLSAYLDGQLSSDEHAQFTARLTTEPELKSALDDLLLMQTRLAELPKLRAPRDFTLTPQTVDQRQRAVRMFTTFRMASVVSSLLFGLIFLGMIVAPGKVGLAPVSKEISVPVAERSADLEEELDDVANLEAPAAPALEMESEEAEEADVEPEQSVDVVAQDAHAEKATGEEVEEAGAIAEKAAPAESTLSASDDQSSDELPEFEEQPASSVGSTYQPSDGSDTLQETAAPRQPLIILEIVLGTVAVVTGFIAFYLRRRGLS
jgi:hypothetical protein